ncbi:hypothetical protein JTE90_024305 [Oedothorax gibbosus]|uniref:YDG domain-containing protein n=1 Tax=Oedothorax gibbosus TaxID=931172 RepID=A0AAV6VWR7_9ARAC|nr:hypothetical protein JTE90_024305 [Oedothorax gibbosus]
MSYYDMVQKNKRENLEFIKSLNVSELYEDLDGRADPGKKRRPGRPKGSTSGPSKRASTSDLTPSRKSRRLTKEEVPMLPDVKEEQEELKTTSVAKRFFFELLKVFLLVPNSAQGLKLRVLEFTGQLLLDFMEHLLVLKRNKANLKNLKSAAQSKVPELTEEHLALSKNVENNLPVRVLRGSMLKSNYALVNGYRYDGLYKVCKFNVATEKFGVAELFKFKFERLQNQEPAPWSEDFQNERSQNFEDHAISTEKENVPSMEMEVGKVPEHPMTSKDKE